MKKLIFIGLVAALVVTGSVFAYAFTTATATIAVNVIQSDFAEVAANATYSPPEIFGKFTGTWPPGTLYDIVPHTDYTGDLVIHVYLVNAAALSRYYHHCNMELYYKDSANVTVDDQIAAQILTLSNADVYFDWSSDNGTPPYYIYLNGGSYKTHKWKQMTGGSVQPQLWLEITQR